MNGVFGTLLSEALEIIDREKITVHKRLSDNRQYIEIIEDQNTVYKLLPNIYHCMCPTFREKVILTNELYVCQHVLAAKLAGLIGKIKIETASDDAVTFSLQLIVPMSKVLANE